MSGETTRIQPGGGKLVQTAEPARFGSTAVSRETFRRLVELREMVRRWNGTVQLVSANDLAVLNQRHIANSLSLLPLIRQLRPHSLLDIGSGGGFPGLVVAVATGILVHLIEADRRKAAFLREASRALGVDAVIHAERAEAVSVTVDVVTARAFAPVHRLWPIAARLLKPQGRGLFIYGSRIIADSAIVGRSGLVWRYADGTVFEIAAE